MLLKCDAGEESLESLRLKEIQPLNPKGINPECSLEGSMLNEVPILWPPDVKNRLIGKDPDTGQD